MRRTDRLRTYRSKRDFGRTEEPSDAASASATGTGTGTGTGTELYGPDGSVGPASEEPRFVVQIHDASTMHFDFRLQVDDVLKSLSIPKGPSTSPKDKRLAVPTEDHPLAYEDFEGVIPEGEYGGDDGEEAWLLVRKGEQRVTADGSGTPDPRRARSVHSGRTLAQVAADVRKE